MPDGGGREGGSMRTQAREANVLGLGTRFRRLGPGVWVVSRSSVIWWLRVTGFCKWVRARGVG